MEGKDRERSRPRTSVADCGMVTITGVKALTLSTEVSVGKKEED
jgi:hypothetical protein